MEETNERKGTRARQVVETPPDAVGGSHSKRMKMSYVSRGKKHEDDRLMHSIGGTDSYGEESLVELGIESFLNDHQHMLVSRAVGGNTTSSSRSSSIDMVSMHVGDARDDHHQRTYASRVLDHCLSACQDALASVHEGVVENSCWDVLERIFHFDKRAFTYKKPLQVSYIGGARIGMMHCFSSAHGLMEYGRNSSERMVAPLQAVVEIPSACFDDKDHLNHRYHAKRVLYLSHILQSLSKKKSYKKFGISSMGWCATSKDIRKPHLCLCFEGIAGVEVHLGTAIPADTFPLSKLTPDRNNLRSHLLRTSSEGGQDTVGGERTPHEKASVASDNNDFLAPTPIYNSGIVEDMICLHSAAELYALSKQCPVMGDVATLLMAWAGHHGLLLGNDGADELFFLELVKIVVTEDHMYTSQRMHLFRGVLQILAHETTFVNSKKGFFMPHSVLDDRIPDPPPHRMWRMYAVQASQTSVGNGNNIVLFIDSTGWRNVARNVSVEAFQQIQDCAKATAQVLMTMPGPDALDAILMQPSNPLMLFDVWCDCIVGTGAVSGESGPCATDAGSWLDTEHRVKHISKRALGDRATLVRVIHSPYNVYTDAKRGLSSIGPTHKNIILCCRLHPVKSTRSVDIGPPADAADAAKEFRSFWGEKSELRRFQDGKICESVVWPRFELNKFKVIGDLLNFIVPRHTNVSHVGLPALSLSQALLRTDVSIEEEIKSERACIDCATRLGKMLKSLDHVTLGIVNIQPVSSVLRNSALYPPSPHHLAGSSMSDRDSITVPRCLPAIELLCQLEGSGKWPDAPAAYQKMKAAIGVQLALSLRSTFGIDASASEHCIDVLYEGFAFRLLLFSERDLQAFQMKNESVGWSQISPAENIPLRQKHQGLISSVAAENPSFKICCRLAKLWIARQYLGNHICEEAIELICAAVYTSKVNIGGSSPSSPELGFLSFLDIIAHHPWEAQPLVLNLKDAEEAARLMFRLQAVGKAPAMFIVMPRGDTDGTVHCTGWTQTKPNKVILFRARALARKSIKTITNSLLNLDSDEADLEAKVFSHSMKDYDILVHLKKESLPFNQNKSHFHKDGEILNRSIMRAAVQPEEAKYCMAVLSGIPRSLIKQRGVKAIKKDLLIEFDPVHLFIHILEKQYDEVVIVCADMQGGGTIGLKIRPKFLKPVPFTPHLPCSIFKPSGFDHGNVFSVILNHEILAQDILNLGAGLVQSVEY